jgi:phosphatidylglycerol:prolipoprotein diacylglycerol transferase
MMYVHDLNPVIFTIWGDFALRWYSLAYIAGFVSAWYWLRHLIRRGLVPLEAGELDQFGLACVVGLMAGARSDM